MATLLLIVALVCAIAANYSRAVLFHSVAIICIVLALLFGGGFRIPNG